MKPTFPFACLGLLLCWSASSPEIRAAASPSTVIAAAGAAEQPLLAAALLNFRGGWFYRFILRLGGAIYTLFAGRGLRSAAVGAASRMRRRGGNLPPAGG